MTLSDAIIKAEELKKGRNAHEIISLLTPFWEARVTTNVGALLAYAYRRLKEYDKCLQICDQVDKTANFPSKIKSQRLWCLIMRDIYYEEDHCKAESEALKTISFLDVNNKYDARVIIFICMTMAERNNHTFDAAFDWLEKVPATELNNKAFMFIDEAYGRNHMIISEKHSFYKQFILLLEKYNKIEFYLNKLLTDFNSNNKMSFIKAIVNDIFLTDQQGEITIRIKKLATILMHIKESGNYIHKNILKITDTLKMSDVSSYVFCPISAVISKTLATIELSIDYNSSLIFSKKFLNDYYEIVKNKNSSWENILDVNSILNGFTEIQIRIFSRIFSSERLALNSQQGGRYLSNIFKGDDISFSPDMVLEDNRGKFCVEEVFTSTSANSFTTPFANDRIKMIGYLKELNINEGYLIYWNISYDNDGSRRVGKISGIKIFEIKITQGDIDLYLNYKNRLKQLISKGSEPVRSINYNKCVNCSVMHYCIHKMGNNSTLLYPYKLNYQN